MKILNMRNEATKLELFVTPIYNVDCLKKNQNTPRPSEHPSKGENVKTFRWDHRLQIQNLFHGI